MNVPVFASGDAIFTYHAEDGVDTSNEATVTLHVSIVDLEGKDALPDATWREADDDGSTKILVDQPGADYTAQLFVRDTGQNGFTRQLLFDQDKVYIDGDEVSPGVIELPDRGDVPLNVYALSGLQEVGESAITLRVSGTQQDGSPFLQEKKINAVNALRTVIGPEAVPGNSIYTYEVYLGATAPDLNARGSWKTTLLDDNGAATNEDPSKVVTINGDWIFGAQGSGLYGRSVDIRFSERQRGRGSLGGKQRGHPPIRLVCRRWLEERGRVRRC